MTASFSVSPMSQTLSLNPGEVTAGSIRVINPSDSTEDLSYQVTVVPYNVSGENYDISTDSVQTFSQIANWITLQNSSGTLKPGEIQDIDFSISVPLNAPAGAQTAALIVSQDQSNLPQTGVGVSSAFSMGSIIYANISGETERGGEILSNNIPSFTLSTPINVTATISNSGNIYETARVTITATNNLTGEPILSSDTEGGNTFSEIILPETTRLISRQIDNLPAVGVVHLEQTILFEGETSVASQDLWICPLWFMSLIVIFFAALIGAIILLVKKHRRKRLAL